MKYKKLNPTLHKAIAKLYKSGSHTTEQLGKTYGVSSRQIQRIAKKFGVLRTQAESNRLMAPLKHYHHVPYHLRAKRKYLSRAQRYRVIFKHPFCSVCGLSPKDGIRLEVDHIDEDATNNDASNLQVLCNLCNVGKSFASRYPVK